jgi:hypothetical protein
MSTVSDVIHGYYAAYRSKDRAAIEALVSDEFTFSSGRPSSGPGSMTRPMDKAGSTTQTIFSLTVQAGNGLTRCLSA